MEQKLSSQEILSRLTQVVPVIEKLCAIAGVPGASIGIMHQNEIIYTKGFGLRDVDRKLPADADTIYHICSLTKVMTCACIQMLVAEGTINLDREMKKDLPDFKHYDPIVESQATLRDFLTQGRSYIRCLCLGRRPPNNAAGYRPGLSVPSACSCCCSFADQVHLHQLGLCSWITLNREGYWYEACRNPQATAFSTTRHGIDIHRSIPEW